MLGERDPGTGLSWWRVGWRARAGREQAFVLKSLSGHAKPGQVAAVMGPSGSGKTTLLDILAMRKTLGCIEGSVLVDGRQRRPGAFQRASAYIPHEDVLLPTLTVHETLQYHAEMRMDPDTALSEKHDRVEEVLQIVGLSKAARTMVGGALPGGLTLRGLSGGEKRRLSIAAAMLPRPGILFADEPTSGLDALASLKVLQIFKDVADSGKIVIVTVHQPRAAIWRLIDTLHLLSEGRLMYTGPASGAVPWFRSIGFNAPAGSSPADWLLDLVSVGFDKSMLDWRACNTAADVAETSDLFAGSATMRGIEQELQAACNGLRRDAGPWPRPRQVSDEARKARWCQQFRTLMWRHALNYHRNLGNLVARLCLAMSSGLLMGSCYAGLREMDATDPHIIPDRLGAIYFICVVLMISPNCTMALFAGDRRFYVAESAAKLYGPLAYYLPMALCELVLNVASAGLFWVPIWAISGMRSDLVSFAWGFAICSLVQLCGAQITNFSALLLPNQELAFVLSVALNIFSFITCGFLVQTSDLLGVVRCLRFFSPVKFGFQALAWNELAAREFASTQHLEALQASLASGAGAAGASRPAWWLRQRSLRGWVAGMLKEMLPCVDPCVTGMVEKGAEALECLGLDEPPLILHSALGLLAQLLALHCLAWLCLRHLQQERR